MSKIRSTVVGSLPKPAVLAEPETMFAPWKLSGDALVKAQDEAVTHWLAVEDKAGLNIVTDGEQRRRHYIWGFLEGLTGTDTQTLGKKRSRGGRYTEQTSVARITGEVRWTGPIMADMVRFARAHTRHTLKVTLPGPMTTADSVEDTVGNRSDRELAALFADLLNQEAKALVAAGADVIQFDEPCFNIYVDQVGEWGIPTLERATHGVKAKIAVHICYGYGTSVVKKWKSQNTDWSHYGVTLPLLAKSTIDEVSIETAASGVDVGVIETIRNKDVQLGVVSCSTPEVEPPDLLIARMKRALNYIEPGHLIASTDCGMVPFPAAVAEAKINALGAAVRRLNGELGLA